jgi:hypothetical protein
MDTPSIRWTVVALLFFSSIAIAQDVTHPEKETVQALAVEILTDTQGVDFGPYLQKVVQEVKGSWYRLIPESAMPPIKKRGKLAIQFTILKDGTVSSMMLKASSGDVALDRAAWGGIVHSNPFSPLPGEFHGEKLGLRFFFYYNPKPEDNLSSDKSWVNSAPPPTAQVVKNQRPALTPKQLAELRVKCAAYTSTTVEDLESKRVALPPHECVGVLGWMRDSRVEELYLPEKSAQ